MRPKSPALRYAFRAAAAALKAKEEKVTVGSLAKEMDANFKTVQRLLYRDRELADELGVELVFGKHTLGQYAQAILDIPSNQRPTARKLSERLGVHHSSVIRFVHAHPELYALHPRFETWRAIPDAPPESIASPRRWRDLGVAVWHENACRYVGVCASKAEYLDYWAKGMLKHQMEKLPKPEHLPTPDEVAQMT